MSIALEAGVWAVVPTPFHGPGRDVDERSLERLVQHYEHVGVSGLTVLGVFGEAAQLSSAERRNVLTTVAGACGLPLVVGATSLSTAPVVEEILAARDTVGDRMTSAMVQVNSPQPAPLATHLQAVYRATGVPLVVQDYPLVSGVSIPTANLTSALTDLACVAAVKAESPPTPPAIAVLSALLDRPVFGGLGGIGLLDELAAGSAGAMTGFSFPEALVACVSAFRSEGQDAARAAFLPYLPLVNFEQQAKIALAVRKECLRSRGLIHDSAVRPPAEVFPEALRRQLEWHLAAVAPLVGLS
ncbi:dihydrodipicolinate synthase family protein [Geodermatophilus sp. URMC 64]